MSLSKRFPSSSLTNVNVLMSIHGAHAVGPSEIVNTLNGATSSDS